MKKSTAASFSLSALLLFAVENHAFCPTQLHHHHQQQNHGDVRFTPAAVAAPTALHLVPGQGKQLEAAVNAASSSSSADASSKAAPPANVSSPPPSGADVAMVATEPSSSSSHWRALAASRSFVTRLFHIPSSTIHKHPHPIEEGLLQAAIPVSAVDANPDAAPSFPSFFTPRPPAPSSLIENNNQKDMVDSVLYPIVGFTFWNTKKDGCIALPTTSHAACRLMTESQRQEEVFGWYSAACKLDLYAEDVCHKPE